MRNKIQTKLKKKEKNEKKKATKMAGNSTKNNALTGQEPVENQGKNEVEGHEPIKPAILRSYIG